MNVYVLSWTDDESTTIRGIYATREMAQRNVTDEQFTGYGRYLKRHGEALGSRLAGDPSPMTFEQWLEREHGLSIEEHFVVGT